MKIGTLLIVIGVILFTGNVLYITEPPIWASVARTIILPGILLWWGIARVKNSKRVKDNA